MTPGRPRVVANFAITADGKVSTRLKTPTGFTSPADKRRLQEIRAMGDALLVGRNTLEIDNMGMRLSADDLRRKRQRKGLPPVPLRVVISNSGIINLHSKLFQNTDSRIVLFSTSKMKSSLRKKFPSHVDLIISKTKSVRLQDVLKILQTEYAVHTLICEGGPTLFRSLLQADVIDEIYITIAPLIFGGKAAFTLTGIPEKFLPALRNFKLSHLRQIDQELFLRYSSKKH
ncbi:MAG: RibD family protein [Chthoniobacterales bacterium]